MPKCNCCGHPAVISAWPWADSIIILCNVCFNLFWAKDIAKELFKNADRLLITGNVEFRKL